ncbi:MAG: hypothetical protein U1C74_17370 [Phenylobacterium sp.]|nr:hypothetical protein [Phenylobacterium sp.]
MVVEQVSDTTLVLPILEKAARAVATEGHVIGVVCEPNLRLPAVAVATLAEIAAQAVQITMRCAFDGRLGHIWIRLTHQEGRVKLSVSNDGVGAPEEPPAGFEQIDALATRLGGFARIGARLFGGSEIAVTYRAA